MPIKDNDVDSVLTTFGYAWSEVAHGPLRFQGATGRQGSRKTAQRHLDADTRELKRLDRAAADAWIEEKCDGE
jgi:hypothetical protein